MRPARKLLAGLGLATLCWTLLLLVWRSESAAQERRRHAIRAKSVGMAGSYLLQQQLEEKQQLTQKHLYTPRKTRETWKDAGTVPRRYLFEFGDSFTSTSFDPTSTLPSPQNPLGNPAYGQGTTCDYHTYCPNWVDIVTADLSPPGTVSYNFAVYGAVINNTYALRNPTSNLTTQIETWVDLVSERPAYAPWTAENSVFTLWFGVNDIGGTCEVAGNTSLLYRLDQAELFKGMDVLYSYGARNFVVLGAPPVDRSPSYIFNRPVYSAPYAKSNVTMWNKALPKQCSTFQSGHAGANVTFLDTLPPFNEVLDVPEKYPGIAPFVDFIHPAAIIQRKMAMAVYAHLVDIGFYFNA